MLALALGIALYAPETVFDLVLIAWSGLGATLGPVLFFRLFRWPLPSGTGLAAMAAGLVAVTGWHLSGFDDDLFKALPGIVAAFLAYHLMRRLKARREAQPIR